MWVCLSNVLTSSGYNTYGYPTIAGDGMDTAPQANVDSLGTDAAHVSLGPEGVSTRYYCIIGK